jgi:ComF family protein
MSVIPQIKRLGGIALDLLFPKSCVGCGRDGDLLCDKCQSKLVRVIPPICPKCGRPQMNGIVCSACVTWKSNIDGIRAPFRFEGTIRKAVHQLKYRNIRSLAGPLAELMRDYLTRNPVPAELVVPVPLHPRRLRERGYNQSELLAKELGKLVSIPVDFNTLVRQKYTTSQARTTSVEQRRVNMTGAFSCRGGGFQNRRIILIDDVATSATTLEACATAIKAAGAISVWGLVLAREI